MTTVIRSRILGVLFRSHPPIDEVALGRILLLHVTPAAVAGKCVLPLARLSGSPAVL